MTYHIRVTYEEVASIFTPSWRWQVADPAGLVHDGRAFTQRAARRRAQRLARQLDRLARNRRPLVYEYRPGG